MTSLYIILYKKSVRLPKNDKQEDTYLYVNQKMMFMRQKENPKNVIDLKETKLSLIVDTLNSLSVKFAV